jgi:hypothetical protein
VELLRNYLTGRKQQIKLQGDLSSWADIQKGCTIFNKIKDVVKKNLNNKGPSIEL